MPDILPNYYLIFPNYPSLAKFLLLNISLKRIPIAPIKFYTLVL